MFKFFISLLSLATPFLHTYNIGNYSMGENLSISYVERFPLFTTSTDDKYIIHDMIGQNNCESMCNVLEDCVGYTYFNNSNTCNLLNSTGEGGYYLQDAFSFKKEVYFYYSKIIQ